MFTTLTHLSLLFAQLSLTPSAPARPAMQDPLRRDTPQSSVVAFLEACQARNYPRAARYLDLRRIPSAERTMTGSRLARQLQEILDGDSRFDVGALSREPGGNVEDGQQDARQTIAAFTMNGTAATVDLERITLPSGLAVWLFSANTLQAVPHLAVMTGESPVEQYLPAWLVEATWLDTPLWRWIALSLLAIALLAISKVLSRGVLYLLRLITSLAGPNIGKSSLEPFLPPMRLLVVIAVFRAGMEPIAPSALLRLGLTRALSLLGILGLVWICMALVDLAMVSAKSWVQRREAGYSFAAFQLGSRVLKLGIVFAAVTALIGSWGYNTSTIWAGLGVGGLALALAAQKTIENLFGGVSVISDRPVAIGDLCRFGDRTGTVEDIGLRSTRLRTPERTLVSVPNAQFSAMTLENFSRRDKILFRTVLNLRRDTTPRQLRDVLDAVAQMLRDDERVDAGKLPVRFIGVGPWSLDVEVFAHVRTVEPDQFLGVQQDLLLRILDIVRVSGVSLALPTQVSVEANADATPRLREIPVGAEPESPALRPPAQELTKSTVPE